MRTTRAVYSSIPIRTLLAVAGIAFVASVLIPASLTAQSALPAVSGPAITFEKQAAGPAERIALRQGIPALNTLDEVEKSASERLAALRSWNDNGMRPLRNGFTRSLEPALVSLDAAEKGAAVDPAVNAGLNRIAMVRDADFLKIGAWAEVAGAESLRLRLSDVDLPISTQFWVYGSGDEEVSFGLELRGDSGELWTPSIAGERIYLELAVPQGDVTENHRFVVQDVMQLFFGANLYDKEGECLVDASCTTSGEFSPIGTARLATGQLSFVTGGQSFVCTGTLVNDKNTSNFIPYMLTANHCFGSQSVANSLEVRWDFKSNSCNGSTPSLGSRPRSNGASLLATGSASDFTFLRLNSVPGNRGYMGWTATDPGGGTRVHRVSHPVTDGSVNAQRYSRSNINNNVTAAGGRPRSHFLYDLWAKGSTFGGSSGSALLNDAGQIVGQLTGGVTGCSAGGYDWNGKFSKNFPSISQFLNDTGTGGGDTSPCSANSTTICLVSNRFEVKATYRTNAGTGNLLWEKHTNNTGLAFFNDTSNKELVLKVLNGCGLNSRYWVFVGGVTDQEINVTVRDTTNGSLYTYKNNLGTAFVTDNDTSAFTCN